MTTPRVRIAPSPTGDPHVGTAYVALFNRTFALSNGGTFLLRIDDTDRTRYREDSERQIFAALHWLGLDWSEGPDIGGPHEPYRQSERGALYAAKAEELIDRRAAYRCFCTPERLAEVRQRQMAAKQDPGYDGHCRTLGEAEITKNLAEGAAHVVRLLVPTDGTTEFKDELRGTISIENSAIDDQVLMKSDGFPTYHLANCVDDIAMGITHVMRAEEWITSTPKHVLIYRGLGATVPKFIHVPLLRNADKSKISKRKNPVSLTYYREAGFLPEAMRNFLATLGWSAPNEEAIFSDAYFREHFRPEDITLGGPVFDLEKLRWMNGHYIRTLGADDLLARLDEGGFLPESGCTSEQLQRIFPLVSERLHLLSDFEELTSWYFGDPDSYDRDALLFKKRTVDETRTLLGRVLEALSDAPTTWDVPSLDAWLEEKRVEWDVKKPELFMPMRRALTGRTDAPGVGEIMSVLGPDRVRERLEVAVGLLESDA